MLLSVRDLKVAYGNIEALHGISFDVDEGEIVTLIGANGAGKSTILMTVSRLIPGVAELGGHVAIMWKPRGATRSFLREGASLAIFPCWRISSWPPTLGMMPSDCRVALRACSAFSRASKRESVSQGIH